MIFLHPQELKKPVAMVDGVGKPGLIPGNP